MTEPSTLNRVSRLPDSAAPPPAPPVKPDRFDPITVVLEDKGLSGRRREELVERVNRATRAGNRMRARLLLGTGTSTVIVLLPRLGRIGLLPQVTGQLLGPRLARGEQWTCHVSSVTSDLTCPDRARVEVILNPPKHLARVR